MIRKSHIVRRKRFFIRVLSSWNMNF